MSLQPAYSHDANAVLLKLEEGSDRRLYEAVLDVIDLICDHPDSAAARRRQLRDVHGGVVWSVAVRGEDGWVVLWWPDDGDAYIAFIGSTL